MVRLTKIIESGSLTNSDDLNKLVNALDSRIARIKKRMKEPKAQITLLHDELKKAEVFREEFDTLSKML